MFVKSNSNNVPNGQEGRYIKILLWTCVSNQSGGKREDKI